jgi:hypothetical protein
LAVPFDNIESSSLDRDFRRVKPTTTAQSLAWNIGFANILLRGKFEVSSPDPLESDQHEFVLIEMFGRARHGTSMHKLYVPKKYSSENLQLVRRVRKKGKIGISRCLLFAEVRAFSSRSEQNPTPGRYQKTAAHMPGAAAS